jgi:SAM-dependent methyltransferase
MALRFCLAIFSGSFLLFLIEPMCGKMVLPLLGGTPAVWNTCVVFFQAGLLAGYAYAHYVPRRLGLRTHAIVHLVLMALAALSLPVAFPDAVPASWPPVFWLLATLTWSIGLPFVLVSANTILLQRWFTHTPADGPRDPYFLYAASNLGSFAGLLSYPLLVEPALPLPGQAWFWFAGYLVLFVMTAVCFPWSIGKETADRVQGPGERGEAKPPLPKRSDSKARPDPVPLTPHPFLQRLRWLVLALVPSSLMLSVTTYLTTDIAPIPLLWVMPLGLYLLTFVLAFASHPVVPHTIVVRWAPLAVIVAVVVLLLEASDPLPFVLAVHLLVLFWLALACHGQLARERPVPRRLTEFYLCVAVGGVLGGMFNALLAPLLFSRLTEYPLMLVLAALSCRGAGAGWPTRVDWLWVLVLGGVTVGLVLLVQTRRLLPPSAGQLRVAAIFVVPLLAAYVSHARPWRFALGVSAILLASALYHGVHGTPVHRERSYFGVHLVADRGGLRSLVHGGTVHGMESLPLGAGALPLTYYHPSGPIGQAMQVLNGDPRLDRVGLVGLGAGSLAYYSQKGQKWTFYEIDPSVIRIAQDSRLFTFLRDAAGEIDIVAGDGRLVLERSEQQFGLLVLDAFGSDAIPLHLLTREALEVCRRRLRPDGILAFHISSKYLDLEPVLANLARKAHPGLSCYIRDDRALPEQQLDGKFASVWVLLAPRPEDLPDALRTYPWRPARARDDLREWTDNYSNIWQVFRWQEMPEQGPP